MKYNLNLEGIRNEIKGQDAQHELAVNKSREVVRTSKFLIYSVHRNNLKKAEEQLKIISALVAELRKITKKFPSLYHTGAFKVAMQEYVEAVCYFEFAKSKKIPSQKQLGVSGEEYLLGICDLVGELVRKATNHAINGEFDDALTIKDFVEEIYGQFLMFDFRNGELRKKSDGMRYDLKKLEDLALDIKFKKN